jgi:hypothetical protein
MIWQGIDWRLIAFQREVHVVAPNASQLWFAQNTALAVDVFMHSYRAQNMIYVICGQTMSLFGIWIDDEQYDTSPV